MSAAGAVQMGSAFVRFFGQANDLYKTFKEVRDDLGDFGSFAKQQSRFVAGSFEEAETAAASFGASTSKSLQAVAVDMTTTGSSAAVAAGGVNSAANSMSALAVASNNAAGKMSGVPSVFGAIKSGASGMFNVFGSLTKNMGGIAKLAGSASWALWATSKAMQAMGKDTTRIDMLAKTVSRFGWAARGADLGIKAVSFSLRSMAALASAPMKIASGMVAMGRAAGGAVSRGVGRLGRMAGVGAIGASAATAGDEEGGAGKAMAGGALSGLMMGGVVGAGVGAAAVGVGMMIKTALSRGAKEGAAESSDFLTQLGNKLLAVGSFFSTTFGTAKAAVIGAFAKMGSGGESFLIKVEKAIFPIVDAIQNVWVPGLVSGVEYISSFFAKKTDDMGATWSDWLAGSIGALADFVGNFDIYFQLAQQTLVMWAGNSLLMVQDFFKNSGKLVSWFADNWQNVFFTATDYTLTAFINLGQNLRNVFAKLWEWVKGGMIGELNLTKEDWKPLTDGARSAMGELPKIFEQELAQTSPEIEALKKQLTDRQAATADRSKGWDGLKYVDQINKQTDSLQKQTREGDKFSAVSARSTEGYSALASFQNQQRSGNPVVEVGKQQLAELKQIKAATKTAARGSDDKLVVWDIR